MDANDQMELVPLAERIQEAVETVYEQHGYTTDGEFNKSAVENKVYDLVSAAVVEKRADRGKLAVTRRNLMSSTYGQVPGPEAWAEEEDPELAAGVYNKLSGDLWRLVNTDATGTIQGRLNGELGLILCKTRATPDKTEAVYVTKDLQCLLADYSAPQKAAIQKAADKMANNFVMVVGRQPGYAKRFNQELSGAIKAALGTSQAILSPAIEAAAATVEETEPDAD